MKDNKGHGQYVNPGNQGFQLIANSNYVDKTMLIDLLNARIGTTERLICVSRPRRFGKSMTANMLAAYYSRGCSSENLFQNFKIAKNTTYHISRNQL